MSQVKEFLLDRMRKLEDSLVPLREEVAQKQAQIAQLERELADLKTAARAIGVVNGLRDSARGVTRRKQSETTIKEAAMLVLAEHPEGLIALDLLRKINERFGWSLVRPSLSPQLSRLKRERKVWNRGSLWLSRDPDLFLHTDIKTK